jgi:hypothetical protein
VGMMNVTHRGPLAEVGIRDCLKSSFPQGSPGSIPGGSTSNAPIVDGLEHLPVEQANPVRVRVGALGGEAAQSSRRR